MKKLLLLTVLSFFLLGCGGGSSSNTADTTSDSASDDSASDDSASDDSASDDSASDDSSTDDSDDSSGLYTGYYLEDRATNPEDPTIGSLYLKLPAEGAFSGSMYFTYFGCQSSNVGAISGTKTAGTLSGSWSGTVDQTSQAGNYNGNFNSSESNYSGTYTVNGGKQFINIADCIEYYIAPKGTWVLYPQNTSSVLNSCNVTNGVVSWNSPAGAALSNVAILDNALAESGSSNATVFQQIVVADTSLQLPNSLQTGKSYTVTITSFNEELENVYNCSTVFTK